MTKNLSESRTYADRLVPIGKRVLVRLLKQETKTPGGLLIPDTGRRQNKGEIIDLGYSTNDDLVENGINALIPGAIVLFEKFAGQEISGEEGLLMLKMEDIIAVELADG